MRGAQQPSSLLAQVKGVDGETCTVSIDGLELSDVRLRAVVNGNESRLLITPTVDSFVLVTDLSCGNMTSLAVTGFSEIDNIKLDLGNTEEAITINGGDNAALVKVIELTEKLNAIEKDINALKQVFSSWVPVVYDGGASLKAAAASWAAQRLTETQQKDIENELIKH